MSAPRISVILPVYNGAEFLAEALASVLGQTFRDFEVWVIDDASTDGSAAVAEGFRDPRVRVVRHERNRRLPATLNHGLDLARGEFVARMDADDVCLPGRFARQAAFLDAHPEIGLCGTWVRLFGAGPERIRKYPVSPEAVEAFRHFHCPFGHPTVMVRRSLFETHRLRYDSNAAAVEDFELWTRLLQWTRGANLPEVLLEYRLHETSVTSRNWAVMDDHSAQVLKLALSDVLPDVTEEQARFHRQVSMAEIPPDMTSLRKADDWLGIVARALDQNREAREVLREVWFRLAMRVAPAAGIPSLRPALAGSFPRRYGLNVRQRALIVGSAVKAWARKRR